MDFKTLNVATMVATNAIAEADNTVAKVILTTEEILTEKNTALAIAGVSILTNLAIDMIPGEWTTMTQIADKLDLADIVQVLDDGADIALLGSSASLLNTVRTKFKEYGVIDKMSSEELSIFLAKKRVEKYGIFSIDNFLEIEDIEVEKEIKKEQNQENKKEQEKLL